MEKGKISAWQLGAILYLQSMGIGVLVIPGITAKYAGIDLWLTPILASLGGFIVVYVAYTLHKLYPDRTIVQAAERILGRIPGKVVGLGICFFYLHIAGLLLRNYAEFLAVLFLPKTPIVVLSGCMIAVCAFAVRGGLEVIGRTAQLIVPVFTLLLLFLILLLLKDLTPEKALPVLEHGMLPVFKGAVRLQGFFTEMLLVAFLFPFVNDRNKGLKAATGSVAAVAFTMVVINLVALFLLGKDTANELYPLIVASRYISVADFFENLEAVAMAIWVLGIFLKLSLFYYAAVLGTAQLLDLSGYGSIVFPLGLLITLLSFWYVPNVSSLFQFFTMYPFYAMLFQAFLPMLLLAVGWVRHAKRELKGG
ncbi:spore gernimation protein [Paenibacillus mesophilus]|uniref:GerAB/ArcD/ProY family transporter n=1 Tax=Paenibacillus mesophilus TaxID=2582849 RepID=UPI00110D8FE7|nr:endospore germination permease [Paenibacillus mesophilus]TMV48915.1 spore gernimation protein [Paenibacillus mesophilus]